MSSSTTALERQSLDIKSLKEKFLSASRPVPSLEKNPDVCKTIRENFNEEKIDRRKNINSSNRAINQDSIGVNISSSHSVSFYFCRTLTSEKQIVSKLVEYSRVGTTYEIKKYFSYQTSERAQKRKNFALQIKTVRDVFEILELGNNNNFVDAYDGAVDLLAECDGNVLLQAFEVARNRYISDSDLQIATSWEKNWEILIKALSCALQLESYQKMSLLLSICNYRHRLSKLIKLTLIDAIVDLDIDTDLVEVMLQIFISKRESDSFVRNYAQEQADEFV